jgi:hypothetical protein
VETTRGEGEVELRGGVLEEHPERSTMDTDSAARPVRVRCFTLLLSGHSSPPYSENEQVDCGRVTSGLRAKGPITKVKIRRLVSLWREGGGRTDGMDG